MKKLHRPLILSILLGLFTSSLFAQETEIGKIKELYLTGNLLTFNNFGLQYKSELKRGTFFRLGLTNINLDCYKTKFDPTGPFNPTINTQIEGRFDVGLEKRKQITEKLTAFYGINVITSISFVRSKREDPTLPQDLRHMDNFSISSGLGFNSGFIFNFAKDFSISAEIIPKLIYTYSASEGQDGLNKVKNIMTGGSFNLDNESVRVSLIYHWIKN